MLRGAEIDDNLLTEILLLIICHLRHNLIHLKQYLNLEENLKESHFLPEKGPPKKKNAGRGASFVFCGPLFGPENGPMFGPFFFELLNGKKNR